MMNTTHMLYARACATAIAAVLALSSTSLFAQDAQQTQPTSIDAAPAATSATAPALESTPVNVDSSAAAPAATERATPKSSTRVTKKTIKRTTHVAAALPAHAAAAALPAHAAATKTVSKTTTHTMSQPVAPAAPVATAQTQQSVVRPIVDVNNKAARTTVQAKPARKKDQTPIIAAGGALAFLAIGGAAVGLTRRRREDEEMIDGEAAADEATATGGGVEPRDPLFEEEPPVIAPEVSAFSWGKPAEQSDRRPGETWVERAYRGPSHDNPSLSLRKRLKRAAFFDQRDREVAAGTAKPVDTDAGLPEAMADEGELESA